MQRGIAVYVRKAKFKLTNKEVVMKKPYKSIYEIAVKRLNKKEDALMEKYLKKSNLWYAKALGIIK